MYYSASTILQVVERKAKPVIANPKARIEDKAKNGNEAWTITVISWQHKCTWIGDIYEVKRRRPSPSIATPKENYWRLILNQQNWNKVPRPELQRDLAVRGLTITISVEAFLQEMRFEIWNLIFHSMLKELLSDFLRIEIWDEQPNLNLILGFSQHASFWFWELRFEMRYFI